MNSIDLDIILKKMRINFSENDKQKIIKILNSQSVSNEITNSGFEYENKITILRIYLEYKKKIINGISKIDPENQFTTLFQNKNKEIETNKCDLNTELDITNRIGKNEYDFNKEINSEIQKGIQEKLEMDNIVISEEIIDNNDNEEKYKEKSLEILHNFLDIKTNILKMKIQIIDSIRNENTEIYNKICNYENDYQDKKKILQEYRENLDIETQEKRSSQDKYYQERKNEIIDQLINKYVENKKDIEHYIKDTQDFYNEYFDNTKVFNCMVYPEINTKENSENSKYKNNKKNRYSNENYKYPIYDNKYSIENYKYPIYNRRYPSENYKYPIYNSRYLTEDYRNKLYKQDYNEDYDKQDYNEDYDKQIDKDTEDIKDNKSNLKKAFETLRIGGKDYDSNETEYFNKLDSDTQKNINEIEKKIKQINSDDIPIRFKVLEKDLTIENKAMIINKLNEYKKNRYLSDSSKYFNWLNGLLKIPFGNYIKLPISSNSSQEEIKIYLEESKKILDKAVYGHQETKDNIIQLLAQWISNPDSAGNVIGIQGPMGNGKTTLVKDGISKAIKRPFEFISLGGSGDSSYLDGHSYTYEGATWGKIVDVLIKKNCMNPVFYFDELDKISNTAKGEELMNLLIHITDITQNTKFQDKYFSGVDIDLSKAVFIFSYNDQDKINPILLDRLIQIKTTGFETEDKIKIFNEFLYKNIEKNLGIKQKIEFSDKIIKFLIEKYTNEKGVRQLNKITYAIMSKINLSILIKDNKYQNDKGIIITENIIKEIIKDKESANEILNMMYI